MIAIILIISFLMSLDSTEIKAQHYRLSISDNNKKNKRRIQKHYLPSSLGSGWLQEVIKI